MMEQCILTRSWSYGRRTSSVDPRRSSRFETVPETNNARQQVVARGACRARVLGLEGAPGVAIAPKGWGESSKGTRR